MESAAHHHHSTMTGLNGPGHPAHADHDTYYTKWHVRRTVPSADQLKLGSVGYGPEWMMTVVPLTASELQAAAAERAIAATLNANDNPMPDGGLVA